MKKVFLSSLAVLYIISGCTKPNSNKDDTNETKIEEETEIEIDENDSSGGL